VFLKEVPAELTKRIDAGVGRLSNAYKLSEEDAARIREAVARISLETGRAGINDERRATIRELGHAAIPLIAELMTSQDDGLRHKANAALVYLIRAREYITDDYTEAEAMLIALLRRSLLDSQSDVRLLATRALSRLAMARWPDMPGDVKTGLASALTDPDPKVREGAKMARAHLGLGPAYPPEPYLEEVPRDLAQQIRGLRTALLEKDALSKEAADTVRWAVMRMDLSGGAEAEKNNRQQEAKIREVGPSAVCVIDAMMPSYKDERRRRTNLALMSFIRNREHTSEGYAQVESLVVLMLRRSLRDINAGVRGFAMDALYAVGKARLPEVREGVIAGFETALKDPDPKLREKAQGYRAMLGLVPPNSQKNSSGD